ncbi:hypothetical protein CC1G_10681 [Coprinopsis cinerea okayama7|uniref:Uncharacterized protein n=1 Tax=Coprinopsis cinerea (strain Okayama-7 / 130 / ATCC MYA-4618 / FGSC 9003) TaxID=240176 RepID=A8NDQ8_COPC7|nr:hypothetical protein CC1G_10681 [Coprinopsis cinerea okayama7\|eukprot:XP_001832832.1 hypothetical protein CC1G_10681 [Coprinopsis cinerea okayama7\
MLSTIPPATTSFSFPHSSERPVRKTNLVRGPSRLTLRDHSASTSIPASNDSNASTDEQKSNYIGPIVGGAVGIVVIIFLFVLGVLWVRRKFRVNPSRTTQQAYPFTSLSSPTAHPTSSSTRTKLKKWRNSDTHSHDKIAYPTITPYTAHLEDEYLLKDQGVDVGISVHPELHPYQSHRQSNSQHHLSAPPPPPPTSNSTHRREETGNDIITKPRLTRGHDRDASSSSLMGSMEHGRGHGRGTHSRNASSSTLAAASTSQDPSSTYADPFATGSTPNLGPTHLWQPSSHSSQSSLQRPQQSHLYPPPRSPQVGSTSPNSSPAPISTSTTSFASQQDTRNPYTQVSEAGDTEPPPPEYESAIRDPPPGHRF